ncbi:hypothetical protein KCU63_g22456, partial [Aureobasidium melanogenum]
DAEPTGIEKVAQADSGLVEAAAHELTNSAGDGDSEDIVIPTLAETGAKTLSMPSLLEPVHKLNFRKNARRSATSLLGESSESTTGASTSTTAVVSPAQTPSSPPLRPRTPPGKPRNLRHNSFSAAATPLVSTEGSNIEAVRSHTKKKGQKDAVEMVKEVNSKAQSSATSPRILRETENVLPIDSETFSTLATQEEEGEGPLDPSILRRSSEPLEQHATKQQTEPQAPATADDLTTTPRSPSVKSLDTSASSSSTPSHLSTAASAAKKWGWQVLNRQNGSSASTSGNSFGLGKRFSTSSANTGSSSVSLPSQPPNPAALKAALLAQPMGRGMPLPPPGTPLPGPQKSLWASSGLNL